MAGVTQRVTADQVLQAIRLLGIDMHPDPEVLPNGPTDEHIPSLLGALSATVDQKIAALGPGQEVREKVIGAYLSRFVDPATEGVLVGDFLTAQAAVVFRVAELLVALEGHRVGEAANYLAAALFRSLVLMSRMVRRHGPDFSQDARALEVIEGEIRASLDAIESSISMLREGGAGA
ncbi:hypothetical protein [Streptacidiphilus neutrinimicus]|uniref:hypothetical protein n=1 Tax=Streptacidiphilus neutrinimicus TaxID=105420 RepID=UPI0005A8320A|nr:hypothetical protein [Streptacidiphilus neutrinimicus]